MGVMFIRPMFIVGIDVGGTFTDLTAVDDATDASSYQGSLAATARGGSVVDGLAASASPRATCDGWSTAPPSAPTPC